MLAQRIRLRQIQEILTNDEGIDIHLKSPIKLVGPAAPLLSYDHDLDELCDEAMAHGTATASIQFCLHLGVAHDEDRELAQIRAQRAATLAAIHTAEEGPDELSSIRRELEQMLRPGQWLNAWTHLNANLRGMSDTPFVLWHINPAHKVSLVDRRLPVTTIFGRRSGAPSQHSHTGTQWDNPPGWWSHRMGASGCDGHRLTPMEPLITFQRGTLRLAQVQDQRDVESGSPMSSQPLPLKKPGMS
jgi:hypothetical protein